MKRFFAASALIELGAGIGLLILPSEVSRLLLGAPLDAPAALVVGRVAGGALLALGVGCGLHFRNEPGPSAKGVIAAMLVYNLVVAGVLAFADASSGMAGVLLWPAVVLHAVMAVWCIFGLRNSSPSI